MTPMLGVLGGMGPAAGAYFAYRVALLTQAARDQDHLPLLLVNDPRVPDRSAAIVGHGQDPLPAMRANLRLLESSGCTCAAIPCNTAHHWYDPLRDSVKMPLIHIVSSVIESLQSHGIRDGRIGLLGTPGTLRSGLYRSELATAGYELLPLSDADVLRLCVRPIAAVKQNDIERAGDLLAESFDVMKKRGAAAVILGCTELPVALASQRTQVATLPVIDSIDALAVAALRHCGFEAKGGPIA